IIGMGLYLNEISPLGVEDLQPLEIRMTPGVVPAPAEFQCVLRTGCSKVRNSCLINILLKRTGRLTTWKVISLRGMGGFRMTTAGLVLRFLIPTPQKMGKE